MCTEGWNRGERTLLGVQLSRLPPDPVSVLRVRPECGPVGWGMVRSRAPWVPGARILHTLCLRQVAQGSGTHYCLWTGYDTGSFPGTADGGWVLGVEACWGLGSLGEVPSAASACGLQPKHRYLGLQLPEMWES